jgi:pimeloyl-ACP methyl ester carboxylesterase
MALTACGSKSPSATDSAGIKVKEQSVSFDSDGLRLTGRVFGQSRVGVVLAHMYPADAKSWYTAARRLAAEGYMALAFNFRGFGDSEGDKVIPKTPDDIGAAKAFLKRRGAKQFAFVGASMGGTASIVAGETQNPMAVVAISSPLRFMGLDAVPSTTHVQRPVLLLAAKDDPSGAFDALQQFSRDLPIAVTKVYSGDAHGTGLLDNRPGAVEEIIKFLDRWAPVNPPTPKP